MSQVTRCPHCATAFKVVADQLRISDGWVRCGQCKEVFDASEHMLVSEAEPLLPMMPLDGLRPPSLRADTTQDSVRVWGSARGAPAPLMARQESPVSPVSSPVYGQNEIAAQPLQPGATGAELEDKGASSDAPSPLNADVGDEPVPLSTLLRQESPAQSPKERASSQDEIKGYELPGAQDGDSDVPEEAIGDVRLESVPDADPMHQLSPEQSFPVAEGSDEPDEDVIPSDCQTLAAAQAESPLVEEAALMPVTVLTDPAQAAALPEEPGFVAAARRKAFWRRPMVRAALLMLGLTLLLMLALQMLMQERDVIAARNPAAGSWLERLCQPLGGCALQAPRRIDAVVIDSSSFLKARVDETSYELKLGIKNNANHAVAMPALELTLTDAQDQTVLRRVLMRDEMGAPAQLAPGASWSGSVSMQILQGAADVAGYRVLAFYP